MPTPVFAAEGDSGKAKEHKNNYKKWGLSDYGFFFLHMLICCKKNTAYQHMQKVKIDGKLIPNDKEYFDKVVCPKKEKG